MNIRASALAAAPAAPRRRFRMPWRAVAAAVAVLIAAGAAYEAGRRGSRPGPPEYHRLGLYHGEALMGLVRHRWAPDGQTIVVGGHHGVTFTRVDNPAVRSLNLHDYALLSVSVNGDLALLKDGVVSSVPFSGGAPRPLVDHAIDADWAPDGRSLAVIRRTGSMNVVEYPAGHAIYTTANAIGSPRVSPDGESIAVFEYDAEKRSLILLRKSGQHRVLSAGWIYASRVAWTPDGREVWFSATRSGNDYPIWAVDLSGHERMIDRVPGRLYVEDIFKDGRALVEHDFSRVGIAFRGPDDTADRDLSWLDLSELKTISPDGSRILFSETGEAAGEHRLVYLRDTAGGDAVRLGEGRALALSPDGKTVLARTQDKRFALLPTGAGQPQTDGGSWATVRRGGAAGRWAHRLLGAGARARVAPLCASRRRVEGRVAGVCRIRARPCRRCFRRRVTGWPLAMGIRCWCSIRRRARRGPFRTGRPAATLRAGRRMGNRSTWTAPARVGWIFRDSILRPGRLSRGSGSR